MPEPIAVEPPAESSSMAAWIFAFCSMLVGWRTTRVAPA
jgi:hypothetical protein